MKRVASGEIHASTQKNQRTTFPREEKSYHILVEGYLVRVASKDFVPQVHPHVDEGPLLLALKAAFKDIGPIPKTYYQNTRHVTKLSKSTLREIMNGNQNVLIEHVNKHTLHAVANGLDILHLCALGGFPASLMYLKGVGLRSVYTKVQDNQRSNATFGRLAAIRGHMNILPVMATINDRYHMAYFKDTVEAAKFFGHAEFLHQAQQLLDAELEKKLSKKNKNTSPEAAVVPPPIPSLRTMCVYVVAQETIRYPHEYTTLLPTLPTLLLEMVFGQLALDPRFGYRTLLQLKKENPELGQSISTSVWVDAARSGEARARAFIKKSYLLAPNDLQPLIDVFEEVDSFVIEPVDEFEENTTKFYPQKREVGTPSIVNSSNQFLQQLDAFTGGVLEGLDFTNMVVIGGSIVGSLLPIPPNPSLSTDAQEVDQEKEEEEEEDNKDKDTTMETNQEGEKKENQQNQDLKPMEIETGPSHPITPTEYYNTYSPFKGSDIDIYIYGLSVEDFIEKVQQIYQHLDNFRKRVAPEREKIQIVKSNASVVFVLHYPFRHVQIVLGKFKNLQHILCGVDIDCSAAAFDGQRVLASPRARMALNRRWTITDEELYSIRGCPQYENRLIKYSRRGFSIVDRYFHRYELDEEEPTLDETDYNESSMASYCGAALVAGSLVFPSVASLLKNLDKRSGGLPYGPNIGNAEVQRYLADMAEIYNTGYGPSETCPVPVEYEALAEIELKSANEFVFDTPRWYQDCSEKQQDNE